jgi:DNA-binding NtrC family response regulator
MNTNFSQASEAVASILVIDDEASICEMVAAALTAKGYQVAAAATSEQAIHMAKNEPVNLVIVDIRMPDMDGLEILRRIKKYIADAVAIVMTGAPDLRSTVESMRQGVFDYIAKPFDLDEL